MQIFTTAALALTLSAPIPAAAVAAGRVYETHAPIEMIAANRPSRSGGTQPADGEPTGPGGVRPGFEAADILPEAFGPIVGIDLGPDGTLYFAAVPAGGPRDSREGAVWAVGNPGGRPEAITLLPVAVGLDRPAGLVVTDDGKMFVAERSRLIRLDDADGDGMYECRFTIAEGWNADGGRFPANGLAAHGLVKRDGFLTTMLSGDGPPSEEDPLIRAGIGTGSIEHIAGGFTAPDGRTIWPAPVALPGGAPSGSMGVPVAIPSGPFAGQYYLGDPAAGEIRRVFLEEVGGVTQGAVFAFTRGLGGGVGTVCVGDDGTIYSGGTVARFGRIVRLSERAGAGRLFEMEKIEAIPGGLRVSFTGPVDAAALADPARYEIDQWYTTPTAGGGAAVREPERLSPQSVTASADGRSVEIMLPGLRPGRVVHIACGVASSAGAALWSGEAWYTLSRMPASAAHGAFDMRILVFSKTAGFRHGSIGAGIAAFRDLGREHGFDVHFTEDASYFDDAVLPRYDAVVFLNTTGDVLDDGQQAAFERYIRGGGGFVGIHSATDTEYGWPWYGRLVGAYFEGHPAVQDAVVHVTDRAHPATADLPAVWERRDEWYNFRAQPEGVRVLASLDTGSYTGGTMDPHPIMWCHEFDGGRAFYTEGGHTDGSFADPAFRGHLFGAVMWAAGRE